MTKNSKKLALTGGYAAAEALKQINPDVMAVYPITPQTPIIEVFSKFKSDGEVDTEVIHVESEHSAISACVGSSAAGARTVTATSSQGLALMNEILYIASGLRRPILMLVSARALAAPLNIHGDHSDVMGARDSGWVQIFCSTPQEVYDKTIVGMKLAEKVKLPVMVIMDGFNTSHSVENMEILEKEAVQKFVGEYSPEKYLLDIDNPVTFGPVALQNSYFEFRKDLSDAFDTVEGELEKIYEEYGHISGRSYKKIEKYKLEDAEKILVAMGSVGGTIKDAIDKLREDGEKVGLLEISLFRPFPYEEVKKALKDTKEVIVLDRNLAFGTKQVLASEISHSIGKKVKSVVYGLGGRDTFQKQIMDLVKGDNQSGYLL
ncbi:MAG TPA: transketolase C-terminal domain-containing protein [Candidatus Moranbacteria bacterium]|nr:transketolase C-terminal domain-containing protein [Candidatus Moranbacteria bacterium]